MFRFSFCILALLLMVIPFSLASDAGISLSGITPSIPLKAQNTTYSYLLSSDTNSSIRVTYYADGNAVAFQFFDLVENTPSAFSRLHSFPSAGLHSFVASISDYNFSDLNSANNSANWVGNVANGTDLYAQDIAVQPTIFLPNTNVLVRAYVKNIGDINLAASFNVSFYYDGNLFFVSTITGLDANQTKETNAPYILPSNFSGSHSFSYQVDLANIIPEGDEANNGKSIVIYDSSEADLIVDSNLLTFSADLPKVNETFTISFGVRNQGGKIASNIAVTAYHSSISAANQLWTTNVSAILPYEKQDLSFSYTPHAVGVDKIIVYIDPNNSIVEQSNENNIADRNFTIGVNDANQISGLPLIFDVHPECSYWLSDNNNNTDQLVSGKIFDKNYYTDANNLLQKPCINLTYINSVGQYLFDGAFCETDRQLIPSNGMTIQAIGIDSDYAKMLFVYQKIMTLSKTECVADQRSLEERYAKCQTDYSAIYSDCEVSKKQYLDCSSQITGLQTNYDTCQTNKGIQDSQVINLGLELDGKEDDCQTRILSQVTMMQTQCDYRVDLAVKDVNALQNTVDTQGFTINVLLAIILCGIFGFSLAFFMNERNKGKF